MEEFTMKYLFRSVRQRIKTCELIIEDKVNTHAYSASVDHTPHYHCLYSLSVQPSYSGCYSYL